MIKSEVAAQKLDSQSEKSELSREIQDLHNKLEGLSQELAGKEEQNEILESQITGLTSEMQSWAQKEANDEIFAEFLDARSQVLDLTGLNRLQTSRLAFADLRIQNLEKSLDAINEKYSELEAEAFKERLDYESLETEVEQLNSEFEKVIQEKDRVQHTLRQEIAKKQELQVQCENLKAAVETAELYGQPDRISTGLPGSRPTSVLSKDNQDTGKPLTANSKVATAVNKLMLVVYDAIKKISPGDPHDEGEVMFATIFKELCDLVKSSDSQIEKLEHKVTEYQALYGPGISNLAQSKDILTYINDRLTQISQMKSDLDTVRNEFYFETISEISNRLRNAEKCISEGRSMFMDVNREKRYVTVIHRLGLMSLFLDKC